jgi:hypothetical protein
LFFEGMSCAAYLTAMPCSMNVSPTGTTSG